MSSYKNILIALECSHNTEQVLAKGAEIKALYPDASYSLVHVVLDVIIADWAGLPRCIQRFGITLYELPCYQGSCCPCRC